MKRVIVILVLICIMGATCIGNHCESQVKNNQVLQRNTQWTIKEYFSLIGKNEETLLNILGEGKKTIERDSLSNCERITRSYSISLYGEVVPVVVICVDDKVVQLIWSPNHQRYSSWYWRISAQLGVPMEIYMNTFDVNQELYASAWNLSNVAITLRTTHDAVCIEVNSSR